MKKDKRKKEPSKRNRTTFQIGNQFWKARAKHGRDAIFSSPEAMWEAAVEYFEWVDSNPEYKSEWKDGELRDIPVKTPYGIHGLCIFWGVNTGYLRSFKETETYSMNPDFLAVMSYIEDVIYKQKFDGASSGFFNANIISRDLGLADKKEIAANVNLNDREIQFD